MLLIIGMNFISVTYYNSIYVIVLLLMTCNIYEVLTVPSAIFWNNVGNPLLSSLCQNNSKLSKTTTKACIISIAFRQYVANKNDRIKSDLTMCRSRSLSQNQLLNSTCLQTVITLPIQVKIEPNYHWMKRNVNSFPLICKSKQSAIYSKCSKVDCAPWFRV